MRRSVRYVIVAATVGGVGVGGTVMAYAGWNPPIRTATVKIVAAKMPPGVTPSATFQDGRAAVSWSAQELRAGLAMQRYTVTAHSVDGTPRPDVAHTVDATGAGTESTLFTASELGGGQWKWTITPRFESWVGAEGRLSGKVSVPTPKILRSDVAVPADATMPAAPASATGPARVDASPPSPQPTDGPPVATPTPPEATTPDGTPPVVESAPVSHDPPPPTGPVKQVPASQTPTASPTSTPTGK